MDDRRKKLRFRAWRRGFREIDLLLGGFADSRIAEMNDAELNDFERLLEAPDQDVYAWITGTSAPPKEFDTAILSALRTFQFTSEKPRT